jgi:hypothetical protein
MKKYEGMDVYVKVFLTSALVGRERSASRPSHFSSGEKNHRYPLDRRLWMGLKAGLEDVQKVQFLTLPGLELRLLDRPNP